MTRIYNKTSERDKRRALRKSMTKAEALLWPHLSGNQRLGFKFRRQYSVGAFVLDFYCPALKLAIELDGASHEGAEAAAYDGNRQAFIESFGIQFLRFSNAQVYTGLEGVVAAIEAKARELSEERPHPTSP